MISAASAQGNSHTVITVQDNHLSNTTSKTLFLSPKQTNKKMSKTLQKQPLQIFTRQRNEKQCMKNISSIIITLLLFYNAKFV